MRNRNVIRKAIGLLEGHCPLKRHLTIISVKNDPTCRGCFYVEETDMHVLSECEGFSAHRFECLGRHVIEPMIFPKIRRQLRGLTFSTLFISG